MQPPEIIVSLVHIQGPLKGEIGEFSQQTIRIGRHPSNDVRFPGDMTALSRYHAEIVREGNRFRLIDKSANGTFVNGKRVTESFLKDGDTIELSEGGPKLSFLTEMREDRTGGDDLKAHIQPSVQKPPLSEPLRREPIERPTYPPPAEPSRPGFANTDRPVGPAARRGDEIVVETAAAPLVIQYGSTVRSYKQLPVTIGQHPRCELVLQAPGILDQHAQVFYYQDRYWLRELTGQRLVCVNRRPIDSPTALSVNDAVALTPRGPFFRFLGEGRLAEDLSSEEPDGAARDDHVGLHPSSGASDAGPTGGILARVKKKLF